jgi:beta-glucanase (GH16 family)
VNTKTKFSQTQGRFDARIKFAGGKGLHDDFWLYPEKNYYPGHAEIDIAEPYGSLPDQMNAAIHMTASDGVNHPYIKSCPLKGWAQGFHTYSLEWTTTSINFSYDGVLCYSFTSWKPMSGYTAPSPFDQNFFVILQNTVDDGSYSPAPDSTTAFPATMQVDWVHVWK